MIMHCESRSADTFLHTEELFLLYVRIPPATSCLALPEVLMLCLYVLYCLFIAIAHNTLHYRNIDFSLFGVQSFPQLRHIQTLDIKQKTCILYNEKFKCDRADAAILFRNCAIMDEDCRMFKDLSVATRLLSLPYRVAEAGYLPDQVTFHKNRKIEALYVCVILNSDGVGSTYVDGVKTPSRNDTPYMTIMSAGLMLNTIRAYRHDEIFFKYFEPAAQSVLSLGIESCHFGLTSEIVDIVRGIKNAIENAEAPGMADQVDLLAIRFFAAIMASHRGLVENYISDGTRFQDLISYVSMHATEKIAVAQLSRKFGMSTRTFYRVWSRKFSITFSEFLNNLRISAAESLLSETGLTMREIANRCGFSSGKYMVECFHRKRGCSPSACKKQFLLNAKNAVL